MEQKLPRAEEVLTPEQEALYRNQIRQETFREMRRRVRDRENRWRNLARYFKERGDEEMEANYLQRSYAANSILQQFNESECGEG